MEPGQDDIELDELLERLTGRILKRADSDPQALAVLDYLLLRDDEKASKETAAELGRIRRRRRAPSDGRQLRTVERRLRAELAASQYWIRECHLAINALLDLLFQSGVLQEEHLAARRETGLRGLGALDDARGLGVSLNRRTRRTRPRGEGPDCAGRREVCRAICCTLRFSLRPEEVESGVVAFDEKRPFVIRRGPDGACTHLDPETQSCTIYDDRPITCRVYDCRKDRKIWRDYERAELTPWAMRRLGQLGRRPSAAGPTADDAAVEC